MLTIDRATYDAIVAHAKRDHPDEAVRGRRRAGGTDRPERLVEMVNAAGSPQPQLQVDSTDLLLHLEDGRERRSRSSSTTRTRPPGLRARTDIGLAMEPNTHYVLVSTRHWAESRGGITGPRGSGSRIVDGEVTGKGRSTGWRN